MEQGRVEELLERGVAALETLASDPIVEYEAGPPICPHCGKYDPVVEIPANDGIGGPLSQFVSQALCTNCDKIMFIVIESYSMHRDRDMAIAEITERAGRNAEDGSGSQS